MQPPPGGQAAHARRHVTNIAKLPAQRTTPTKINADLNWSGAVPRLSLLGRAGGHPIPRHPWPLSPQKPKYATNFRTTLSVYLAWGFFCGEAALIFAASTEVFGPEIPELP